MNFEYSASGSIKFKSIAHYTIKKIRKERISYSQSLVYKPMKTKRVRTNRYSLLENGGIATNGFVDKFLSLAIRRDKSVLVPFLFGKCA